MMGSSCSSQRHHNHSNNDDDGDTPNHHRHRYRGHRHLLGVRMRRTRTFPFCGGTSQDGCSSDDEQQPIYENVKRRTTTRHSIIAEVPDLAISTFYPPEDNYEVHPTDSSKRYPKSLTDLCIHVICRSLPNLNGKLPVGLPKVIVDRILQNLTSHAALNSTTLHALSNCEIEKLSLANCRGVSDQWILSLQGNTSGTSIGSGCDSDSSSSADEPTCSSYVSVRSYSGSHSNYSGCHPCPTSVERGPMMPSLADAHPAKWLIPSNTDGRQLDGGDTSQDEPRRHNSQEVDKINSYGTTYNSPESSSSGCSTSTSFVSASSCSLSPFHNSNRKLSPPPIRVETTSAFLSSSFHASHEFVPEIEHHPIRFGGGGSTSTLTLLDLRGSQCLTDRGLLQLSCSTPLRMLEVLLLDNCHGITGRGLRIFAKSHRLHTISMSNCRRLTDEAMVNLQQHLGQSITTLNLGGCRCLTRCSLESMSNFVELRRLDLTQCDLITDDALVYLDNLPYIEELSLGWCRSISDVGLGNFVKNPHRSQLLRTLRLARCAITDVGLKHLAKLVNLEELDLNGCDGISSKALGDLLEKLEQLKSLDVSHCPRILSSCWQGKINALKSLELCYSCVSDSQLFRWKNLPSLEELNLDSCMLGDAGIAHLIDNNVMPNLTTLDLADTSISDAAMEKIAQFNEMRQLSLFYCNITNRGLRYLANMKNLEVLNLDSRDIGDEGLRYLRGLNLRSLDIFSSRVTDIGCAYLSKIKTLTSLELCGGGIGDWGCAHLASLHNLTSLNLSQNENVTNRGAAALAALTNLKALNLSNTRVDSDALKFFSGLLKLQSLALYGCADVIGSPKLSPLQSALPSLRCLRLNSASNEDGIIDCVTNDDSDVDADNESDIIEEFHDDVSFENDEDVVHNEVDVAEDEDDRDHDEISGDDHLFRALLEHLDGNHHFESSDDDSMEDFHDAYNEVESSHSRESTTNDMEAEI